MASRSLHIGINYPGTACELGGCVNDAENLAEQLVKGGFVLAEHVQILREAGCREIVSALQALARESRRCRLRNVFISYSGHGTSVPDSSGDESDQMDECICPADYSTAGIISDDTLRVLLGAFYKSTKITVLMDCCHSGSILDLPFVYTSSRDQRVESATVACHPKIIMISGCMDAQTSADAYDSGRREQTGAMTSSFLDVIALEPAALGNAFHLVTCMRILLKERGMNQVPELSTSVRVGATPAAFFP
jgi:hypothetical protein